MDYITARVKKAIEKIAQKKGNLPMCAKDVKSELPDISEEEISEGLENLAGSGFITVNTNPGYHGEKSINTFTVS